MNAIRIESIPTAWDVTVDLPFFRITATLFSAEFCLGASVLLAANDDVTAASTG